MNTEQSIRDILEAALKEIRDKHGVAVQRVSAEWIGTIANPAGDTTRIEFEGSALR